MIVIDNGKLKYDGGLRDLQRRWSNGRRVVVRLPISPTAEDLVALAPLELQGADLVATVPAEAVGELVGRVLARFPSPELSVEPPPLEDAIARLFREKS